MRALAALVGAVVLAAGGPACSQIVGIGDLEPSGSSGAGSSGSTAPFLGTWTITSGSTAADCGGNTGSGADSGQIVVTAGTSSQLVFTSSTCTFTANVTSSNVATLLAGQSCSSENVTFVPSQGTFTIAPSGTSASLSIHGSGTDIVNGSAIGCTFDEEDELTN
jgi:hypothetical protein